MNLKALRLAIVQFHIGTDLGETRQTRTDTEDDGKFQARSAFDERVRFLVDLSDR